MKLVDRILCLAVLVLTAYLLWMLSNPQRRIITRVAKTKAAGTPGVDNDLDDAAVTPAPGDDFIAETLPPKPTRKPRPPTPAPPSKPPTEAPFTRGNKVFKPRQHIYDYRIG